MRESVEYYTAMRCETASLADVPDSQSPMTSSLKC